MQKHKRWQVQTDSPALFSRDPFLRIRDRWRRMSDGMSDEEKENFSLADYIACLDPFGDLPFGDLIDMWGRYGA